jgi:hypothetical protein
MAELEIHHEVEGGAHDEFGKTIGILTSVLAVLLAIVTIVSHRAHTHGVLVKADANDKWAYYQSKRIKLHNIELGQDLISVLAPANSEAAAKKMERLKIEQQKYLREGDEVQAEAKKLEAQVEDIEARALRYDFGEGLLEISLVLSSLYFLSKKKFFPALGLTAALAGVGIFLSGYLL